jgi:hypothetical protein
MSWQNNKVFLHGFITLPVALIIIGAFTVAAAAVIENLRFIRTTNQILSFVALTRSMVVQQSGFAQNPGEDVWVALEHAGQVPPGASHLNAWHGDMRATVLTASAMRVENDLPTHDCRRLAIYFTEHDPAGLGVLAIEGQSTATNIWATIYPSPAVAHGKAAETACGNAPYARLAFVFKLR